jgi:hypothetical protein
LIHRNRLPRRAATLAQIRAHAAFGLCVHPPAIRAATMVWRRGTKG